MLEIFCFEDESRKGWFKTRVRVVLKGFVVVTTESETFGEIEAREKVCDSVLSYLSSHPEYGSSFYKLDGWEKFEYVPTLPVIDYFSD